MNADAPRPSREEIENLCLLCAVEPNGCTTADLGARLGLSPELAPAVEEAIGPLLAAGMLDDRDGMVVPTQAGRAWLRRRLLEFRVSEVEPDQLAPARD